MTESTTEPTIKPGYKKTSNGIIPEDWKEIRLEKAAKIIMGASPRSSEYNDKGVGLPLIQGNADLKNRVSSPRQYTSQITKTCLIGDILMSVRAPVGEISKSIHKACIGRGVCAIRSTKEMDNTFLFYNLIFREYLWNRLKQGSTFESINSNDIRGFKILKPSLKEQSVIAKLLTTWDAAIEKLSKLIAAKKQQKKGLMQGLFNGQLSIENGQLIQAKEGEDFTEDWEEVKLENIVRRVTKRNKELNDNVVTISAKDGFINQEEYFNKRVASATLTNYYLIEKGDFCYNKSYSNGYPMGAIKRLNHLDKAVVTTLYICFRAKDNIDISFLTFYFDNGGLTRGLMQVTKEGGRAHGLLNIGIQDFFDLKLKIPSLKEQTTIAKALKTVDHEIEVLEQKLAAFQTQKKGLMQVLLTGEKRLMES